MTKVNVPIAKTFGWLGVNGTETEPPDGKVRTEELFIKAGESRTVLIETESEELIWSADVSDGSLLRLIQVSSGGKRQISRILVKCGQNARFEWYRIILGGTEVFDQCTAELKGDGSSFQAEIGYRLKGQESLDMNVEALHIGRKTKSMIHASGVMSGESSKILRGTIDLRKGCKGAVGNELEEVLLLDPSVKNRSVPVILCSEEDVVGNHGATIGRLDEQLSYYLQTRGLSAKEAEKMMARARVKTVIGKIPDEAIRERILKMEEMDA